MAGYTNGKATKLYADDVLASTDVMEKVTISIAEGTEDAGNLDNVNVLRMGLVLARLTSGPNAGKFTVYDPAGTDGEELEDDAVVLGYEVDMTKGGRSAMAYFQGTFWSDKLIVDGAFNWLNCQRLRRLVR
jgi:hypothetical protein